VPAKRRKVGKKAKDESPELPERLSAAVPISPDDQPEQAAGGVTGGENIARQQQDPDLKDTPDAGHA
jgi:hypothetical protein